MATLIITNRKVSIDDKLKTFPDDGLISVNEILPSSGVIIGDI